MGKIRLGINGFGRIGRQVLKTINHKYSNSLEVVAINDLSDTKTSAHLLKYDSTHGIFNENIKVFDNGIALNGNQIKFLHEKSPANIDWANEGVEIVIESTGFFTDAKLASDHLGDSVKKVIISAPAQNEDLTIVLGVNNDDYNPKKHNILSNASCTTNCVAPMVKVLNDNFELESAFMSTIHAYTNDQNILDQNHSDLRRARAAAASIIPTTTGAAKAVTKVIPDLEGKIDGMAYRVPVISSSVTDLTVKLKKDESIEKINELYKDAASGNLKGILDCTYEELVSSDFIGNPYSCTIDLSLTSKIQGTGLFKIVGWYDNEWGYASRTSDLVNFISKKL
ncbi:MAG: type I glyceraldehyde-3-phosphate dehydrogenase [Dehalococcoidia bacterium]